MRNACAFPSLFASWRLFLADDFILCYHIPLVNIYTGDNFSPLRTRFIITERSSFVLYFQRFFAILAIYAEIRLSVVLIIHIY